MPGITPEKFFEVFDGNKPAGRFYVDCSNARGGAAVAARLARTWKHKRDPHHALFTGHIGCGKSSELQRLAQTLTIQANTVTGGTLPILVDCEPYLDERDFDLREVLMTIVVEMADTFRGIGIEIKDHYFQKRLMELRDLFMADVSLDKLEASLGSAKTVWSLNQRFRTHRKEVREKLGDSPETLIGAVNDLIFKARTSLLAQGKYHDFCFIVDGLEKMQKLAGREAGELTHVAFFLDDAYQLRALGAHTVWTVPLAFARRFGPELAQIYGEEPFVLPMIKVRYKSGAPDNEGCEDLAKIVKVRLADTPVAEVIDNGALELAIKASGGHVRHFVRLIESAGLFADDVFPIGVDSMGEAIDQMARVFQDTLADEDYVRLANLELSEDKTWEQTDPAKRRLLDQLCVLEYVNGEQAGGPTSSSLALRGLKWYAVHPIVQALPPYQRAVSVLSQPKE